MSYPILAPNYTWYSQGGTSTSRTKFTQITILDSYSPTGSETESWNADVENSGSIKCYINGTELIIAGNGSGRISMNSDSKTAFASNSSTDIFNNVINIIGLDVLNTSRVTTMMSMFFSCSSLTSLNLANWDVSSATNMSYMFFRCSSLTSLDLANWNVSNVTNMSYMFSGCSVLADPNIGEWNVSNVTNMQGMFNRCQNITSNLPIGNWDVSNVLNMSSMFSGGNYGSECATGLTTLNVSNWNVSNCEDMGWMFYGQKYLTSLDLSKWNVSKVKSFHHMFAHDYRLIITGIENWDTSSAETFNCMLNGTANSKFDISKWDTSKCESFSQMFEGCTRLTEVIGLDLIDTSKSKSFVEMFSHSSIAKLNLSNFDTTNADSSVRDPYNNDSCGMNRMFYGMTKLREIKLGEKFNFAGNGKCNPVAVLPTPSLNGASGKWHSADCITYAAEDVPSNVLMTYYAIPNDVPSLMLIRYGTMYNSAEAIRKMSNSTDLIRPSEMAEAIKNIQVGIELPELTTPANEGDIVSGKEYIDGSGDKKTGTLVVCDTIQEAGHFGVAGTGVSLDIESSADGSNSTLTLREPKLVAENIVAGSSIFGVPGTAKTLRVKTGTFTLAEDAQAPEVIHNLGVIPDLVIVEAADHDNTAYSISGFVAVRPELLSTTAFGGVIFVINSAGTEGGAITTLSGANAFKHGLSDTRFVCAYNNANYKYRAGWTYQWKVFAGMT